MILDGWGIGNKSKSDVIFNAHPKFMNSLMDKYPHAELLTSGENVGLPDGQMGNSEVGHQNIGAGRVIYQDLVKINIAIRDKKLASVPEVAAAFEHAKANNCAVHFMGLVSDGGVHSTMEHLKALCEISAENKIKDTFIHCFMDGRDTDPKSGKGFIEELHNFLDGGKKGKIADIIGRFYAMDRDKRWERVKEAYDLMVKGAGQLEACPVAAMQKSYDAGITDEFIKPIVIEGVNGQIKENDVVIFFNYRNDRAKEITQVLTQADMPEMGMKTIPLYYCTMTPYDSSFEGMHILFNKDNVVNTLGEHISKSGLKQLRIAETEKFAHVTFFFNGGQEQPFAGEKRILINSPKVATYDLQPEMSAYEVADALVDALKTKENDFICLNFANGDMVGHTGIYPAIEKAIKAVDQCVEKVVTTAKENGYTILICADHGNADFAVNQDGSPNTAHSLNPVPLVVISDNIKEVHNGILADLAPTVLKIMGLDVPSDMTGKSLI